MPASTPSNLIMASGHSSPNSLPRHARVPRHIRRIFLDRAQRQSGNPDRSDWASPRPSERTRRRTARRQDQHDKMKPQIVLPSVVIAGAVSAIGYSAFMPDSQMSTMRSQSSAVPPSPPSPPHAIGFRSRSGDSHRYACALLRRSRSSGQIVHSSRLDPRQRKPTPSASAPRSLALPARAAPSATGRAAGDLR